MTTTYDPQSDALYLKLSDAPIAETVEDEEGNYLDLDAEGQIVGVEVLDASSRGLA